MLDRTVYWLFRLAILLTRPMPLRVGYWFSEYVALICYFIIFPRHRKALRANLAQVLQTNDSREIEAVARRAFRNFGKFVIDFIHYPLLTKDEVRSRVRFDRWDDLELLRAGDRGVVIATMHVGSWDLGAAALAAYGFPVNAIVESFAYPPMDDLVKGSRAKLGMRVIGRDRIGTSLFRALRRGETLALLIDVAEPEFGIYVDFFGAPAFVSSAPARIALRTNAWVMPSIVIRGPDDDLVIRPIVDVSLRDFTPSGDEEADVYELTRRILHVLEAEVRPYADQWFIFRRMWARRSRVPVPATGLAEGL